MKVTVMALVVRNKADHSIIDVYPVGDIYDYVSMEYNSKHVTPEEIRTHVESWMGKDHPMAIRAEESIRQTGIWTDQQEAKDFSSVGNMIIDIEEKEVDWS